MKWKVILSMIWGLGAISLSYQALAGWEPGPCPQPHTGPAPCIESITISDGAWHFNGGGGHDDEWHGAPGGGNISFSGPVHLGCDSLDLECNVTLVGQIKKCQGPDGNWHVGIRADSFNLGGAFPCGVISLSGFPWYSKDPSIVPHCAFEDACENFNPYVLGASSYTFNIGSIDISVLSVLRIADGHIHNLVFSNPGAIAFDSAFYDCDENDLGCTVNGIVHYNNNNGDEINIY